MFKIQIQCSLDVSMNSDLNRIDFISTTTAGFTIEVGFENIPPYSSVSVLTLRRSFRRSALRQNEKGA